MIPFEELIAALERYKRRIELEAAAGSAAPAAPVSVPKAASGKGKTSIVADDYTDEG
jgi:hypothetical protein